MNLHQRILIAFVLLFLLNVKILTAQGYTNAIGLRGGVFSGITGKHLMTPDKAIEGIFSTRWRGFNLCGLYELYKPTSFLENLYWYYGAGAHIGSYRRYSYYDEADSARAYPGNLTTLGLDGILGLEYKLHEIPFVVSVDFKPTLDFISGGGFFFDAALSARYYFSR